MRAFKIVLAINLVILVVTSITAFGEEAKARRPARDKWDHVSIEARVDGIDRQNRELILRGQAGELMTLKAGEDVKRFDEIELGDLVHAEFWAYIKAEFRDPTPEELKEPLVILTEAERAGLEMPPTAIVSGIVKAVVTIEIINRPDMMVTVKGPGGNYVSIPASDPDLLTQLRIGEVAIVTYAESVAIFLEKVGSGK